MRVARSYAAATASFVGWLLPLVSAISVPSGKLTPITPARPTPRPVNPHAPANSAPVVEYSQDNPEPPPLDPSYVPRTFNYFDTLAKHHVYYFPVKYRNFNALSNHIEYEPPQKFYGQTLGKNIGYKPYKQQLTVPYYPVWASQRYQPPSEQYQPTSQQYQLTSQQQYQPPSQQNTQYSQQNNHGYIQQNQYPQQMQQQQYEAVSTQSSPTSTAPATAAPQGSAPQTLQAQSQTQTLVPKVDYSTGKGSYDVTGKGGSKSEYYTKEDWSKKTSYPKKVLTSRSKYPGKY